MKLQHWITVLALLAMAGIAMGCEEEAEETTETPTAETPPEETGEAAEAIEEAPVEGAEGEPLADGVCGQAQACCEAYVTAVGANNPAISVEATCAGVAQAGSGPAADTACQNMINGWRTSLEALPNVETPGACAGN